MVELLELIRKSRSVIVFTGAGISKDSGIQTFRDADGLWKDFDPNVYATYEGFMSDPVKVWKWYLYRYEKIKNAKPNKGHYFVATLERHIGDFTVITQNIDGLHKKAGSENIIELHGNIHRVKCCSCRNKFNTDDVNFDIMPPLCECGGLIRPDVVWFGESLPHRELNRAFNYASNAKLVIVIGTSCQVFPAGEIPFIVKRNGGAVVEINPEETPLTPYADICVNNISDEFYDELMNRLNAG
ncbi:MAG: NAD-dependent deacylase [Proteobacteria bacterium]|nr:NAD-dependent deacylase [Pseudomonadota bacterium]